MLIKSEFCENIMHEDNPVALAESTRNNRCASDRFTCKGCSIILIREMLPKRGCIC
jgi:hypothetical protein